jgi:hypothetical protein
VASKSGVQEREREKEGVGGKGEEKKFYPDGISNQNFLAALSVDQSLY